ncbi:hypothetical protein C4568_02040 [Candidatus Parcubacteria bacterium]|nr:MAG: hypothetical protein C4568_02040 [Candidatus Parcubacteria bacterium]
MAMPLLAHAQETGLQRIVTAISDVINFALGILIGIAIIAFFWGLVRYLFVGKGSPVEQKQATMFMIWGLIGLFFMLSVFGLVKLLQVTFGIDGASSLNAPAYRGTGAAQTCNTMTQNFGCFAQWVAGLFTTGTAILVGSALVIYFWGIAFNLFGYSKSGNTGSAKKMRDVLLWGLIALFVMFSIWGILRVLGLTLFGSNNFNSLL